MDCHHYNTELPEHKRGQHLQREERGVIQALKQQGLSNRAIARDLKCSPRVYLKNSQCDRKRGIFALSKTFFRRNTDVFQGKMVQRSVKRSAVRVRWEFSDTP